MEFTILRNSEVQTENVTYRIDAEYFKREFLDAVKAVEKRRYSYINEVTLWVTQGPNPIFSETGIPCLTGRNINKGEVSYYKPDYVNDEEYKKLSRYQLKVGDTLITLKGKGSIGKIGYVNESRRSLFSRDIGIVRPNKINPGYLNVFILCKYGKMLVDRGETGGTGQSTLATSYLKSIPVPRFDIEDQIGDILYQVEKLRQESKAEYEEAQTLLLTELGLTDWQPKHRLSFVKNHSDTEGSERIDAEHFQPKYDQLMEFVFSNSLNTKKIAEIQTRNSRGLQPKYIQDGSVDVVTSKHILEDGLDYENFEKTNQKNWDEQERARIKMGDILTYTTGANIGRTAMYSSDRRALASNHVNVLTIKYENPEYVAFIMNSIVGRLQTEKMCTGSAQVELYPRDIEKFVIPFIAEEKQLEVQQKITESFRLREQSKHLLESAKRAVEIAIEQDEKTAIKWLKKQME